MSEAFYTSATHRDLADILDYIAKDKSTAALRWVEKTEAKCLLIAQNPGIGKLQPHLREGVRASLVGRYVIFHRLTDDRVEILRVIAGDRNLTRL